MNTPPASSPENNAPTGEDAAFDKALEEKFMDELMLSTIRTVSLKAHSRLRDALKEE